VLYIEEIKEKNFFKADNTFFETKGIEIVLKLKVLCAEAVV